jgi:hypothetical protein
MSESDLVIGLDVGSTTVKAVVVEPDSLNVVWHDYQRHHTQQPEKTLELLEAILAAFPQQPADRWRIFLTGSGSGPLVEPTGGKFVQEVNAVTLAVERKHPDVMSVIELGGQDAKIIMFKEDATGGPKTALASMNDKCASGTGATIDKCMIKVGAEPGFATSLHFDDSKLHHVAAKCGVFAETDIVNLVKSGIPTAEVLNSLADAIVLQNLSVLTRGNTLKAKVLLLGGPTPTCRSSRVLAKRIPETWRERGYDFPSDVPIEELIFVPDQRAVLRRLRRAACTAWARPPPPGGFAGARTGCGSTSRTAARRGSASSAGPPLSTNGRGRTQAIHRTPIPRFEPARFSPGQVVRGGDRARRRFDQSARRCSSTSRATIVWRRPTSSRRATPSRTPRSC